MNELIIRYIDFAIDHENYTFEGNYKKGNIAHHKLMETIELIKSQDIDIRKEFYELLKHDNDSVKIWTSVTLLKTFENESLSVLNEISKQNKTIVSLSAEMSIKVWKDGLMTDLVNWNDL